MSGISSVDRMADFDCCLPDTSQTDVLTFPAFSSEYQGPMLTLFFLLLCIHALCDYALVTDFMFKARDPKNSPHLGVPWYYPMAAHALIHGAGVFAVTGSAWLGIAETAAHFLIDWNKCLGRFGIHVDQGLHIACKVAWLALIWGMA